VCSSDLGQRQRVAIGRAIVRDPEVFLFDEPLSNLDASLRVQTRIEIAKLHERLESTMIYVTHDQVEAMTLADKIVVLKDGLIEQVGKPMELYNHPNNVFVAGFIGSPKMNLFDGSASKGQASITGGGSFSCDANGELTIGIRPEHLVPCDKASANVSGKLELVEQLGEYALLHLITEDGKAITTKLDKPPTEKRGEIFHFKAKNTNIHVFDRASGNRI